MKETALQISIRRRLLNLAREQGEDYNHVLIRYALERLLYRLCESDHQSQFVLKGAALFAIWTGRAHRPTKDLDLLGFGEDSEQRLARIFTDVCAVEVEPDGMAFDPDSVTAEPIREDQEYQGKRIKLVAYLGKARIGVQIDVGFGDVITPKPLRVTFPTLLEDFAAPVISSYPQPTVIAEKFHAMTTLGEANTRMKDFYDLLAIVRQFEIDGGAARSAIVATFKRRGTALPDALPLSLSSQFVDNPIKQSQWSAFCSKSDLDDAPPALGEVAAELKPFFEPLLVGEMKGKTWTPGEGWG